MKNEAHRRVRAAAEDARSGDDLVAEWWDEDPEPKHSLDQETLDEQASTQMGEMYETIRRDAN